jgi:hypothetical protein
MKGEDYLRSLSRHILFRRIKIGNTKNIKQLISRLQNEKKYLSYPTDICPPAISNYSFFSKSDKKWLDFYRSVYGKADKNFISVPIYLYIENCLNDRFFSHTIEEKNFYDKFLRGVPTPTTVLRRINGFYYDNSFQNVDRKYIMEILKKYKKLILKPSVDSGAGRSISVFENNDGVFRNSKLNLNLEFLDKFSKDFIIQEFVIQHAFFSKFNPSCNNTIKVFAYRSVKDDSVNLLHYILWVGAKGHFLDHDHWGGVGLSINDENRINKHAIDLYGNKYEMVNNIALNSIGDVPGMEKIKALARKIVRNFYYVRLIALDFTINLKGNPLLLEVNCRGNGIHQYQMHNGGLFKEFTKEILDYCEGFQPRFVVRI